MPCNSDHLKPHKREKRLQETAQLLLWLRKRLGKNVSYDLEKAADNIYCKADYVSSLCAEVKNLSEDQMDEHVWNGRDKNARRLADWWERHQEADRKREKREREQRRKETLKEQGKSKLTGEEKDALGL